MFIVGISGFKRSGKDTFAQYLMEELNKLDVSSVRKGFADPLKEETADFLHNYFYPEISYDEYLRRLHADGEIKEQYRLLIQWWGTEGRRMHNDPEYWITKMREFTDSRPEDVLLIPDTRFMNEINYIKEDENNLLIVVNRPGIVAGSHPSEKQIEEYDDWSYVVNNDEDIDKIRVDAKSIALIINLHLLDAHKPAKAICQVLNTIQKDKRRTKELEKINVY